MPQRQTVIAAARSIAQGMRALRAHERLAGGVTAFLS
jgi:hypothetical protein